MTAMTIPKLFQKKADGEPIVMVTAYDYPGARAADEAGVDMILVGDSAAQVVLGYESTVPVSTDELLMLARAVRRGTSRAFVVCDLPFGASEVSDEQAVESSLRFVKEAGADAVKLEGGAEARVSRIRAITAAGIPVVAHLGLTPQTATALGGLRAQGRTEETAVRLVREALAVEAAGAFALVVEAVPAELTALIGSALRIPIIGIGAGTTDGQVLVFHDLVGLNRDRLAKFVKQYGTVGDDTVTAIRAYAADVREGLFPAPEHTYAADAAALAVAQAALGERR